MRAQAGGEDQWPGPAAPVFNYCEDEDLCWRQPPPAHLQAFLDRSEDNKVYWC